MTCIRDGASPRVEIGVLLIPAVILALTALPVVPPAHAQPTGAIAPIAAPSRASSGTRTLRVCADPNNLPFTDSAGQGFENRLAELVAREMGRRVEYTWWAQRRGFMRNTLRAELCDLVTGIPTTSELALVTRPYYRSTYVFVQKRAARPRLRTFDDEALRRMRIGVHYIGDDYANTPPAHALTNRGLVKNVRGFSIYGDYRQPSPPARVLDALVAGEIDVAIVWGPLAGAYAKRSKTPLMLTPVSPQIDVPFLPFVYDISMGVRRTDPGLHATINDILVKRRSSIDSILDAFGIPRLQGSSFATTTRPRRGTP